MNLKEFKSEFRLVGRVDEWGYAMEAMFEACGHLFDRTHDIPDEWNYGPSPFDTHTDEESYWFEQFQNATDEELLIIGNFLHRYCEYLRFKGIDY